MKRVRRRESGYDGKIKTLCYKRARRYTTHTVQDSPVLNEVDTAYSQCNVRVCSVRVVLV